MSETARSYLVRSPGLDYRCCRCDAHGVKLWRDYQTFLEHLRLFCGPCALVEEKVGGPIDEAGRLPSELWDGAEGMTDMVGNLVPAVPYPDGSTFWGYSSAAETEIEWWRSLPLTCR